MVIHSCMVHNNKTKMWGDNGYGQLGYGDTNNRGDASNEMGDSLLEIDLGTSFIPMQIVTGKYHTCALSTANKVKCCGWNIYGQLGYGDTNNRGDEANEMGDILLEIDLGTNFIPMKIVAGKYHTCALSTANKVKCWGYNLFGHLGYGDTNHRGDEANQMGDTLLEIDLGTSFIPMQIVAGMYHTCALSTANKVKCWGFNAWGQLGYGDTNRRGDEANEMGDILLEIDLGTSFIPMQIVAGMYHTCALSTAYKVKCWGYNLHGSLGYGDTNDRGHEPKQMGDILLEIDLGTNFISMQIVAGMHHTCALST
eukprot:893150_1